MVEVVVVVVVVVVVATLDKNPMTHECFFFAHVFNFFLLTDSFLAFGDHQLN